MKNKLRQQVWNKYDCKCAYCGEDLPFNKMQVDHINPKYLGGKDNIDNYNPSCRQCNFYKSTFSIDGFRSQLKTILERVKKPFIVRLAIKYNMISFNKWDGKFHFEKETIIIKNETTNRSKQRNHRQWLNYLQNILYKKMNSG